MDPEAASLMFDLISSRYERASMIVTSNKPFSCWWGRILGDDAIATAMMGLLHEPVTTNLSRRETGLRGCEFFTIRAATVRSLGSLKRAICSTSAFASLVTLAGQALRRQGVLGSVMCKRGWQLCVPGLDEVALVSSSFGLTTTSVTQGSTAFGWL